MEMIGGLTLIVLFVVALIAGAAILVDRIWFGRAAVENAPGWACWGAHIILAFIAMTVAYNLAFPWNVSMPVRVGMCVSALVGGYFGGVWLVGHGKDPDELFKIEHAAKKSILPRILTLFSRPQNAAFFGARKAMPKRRNGKSELAKRVAAATTDAHERGKDFLTEAEIDRLLDGAKKGRQAARDHLPIQPKSERL